MTVLPLLKEIIPHVDVENCTTLIDDGLLESSDITSLIADISDQFDIEIPASEIVPENFNSYQALDSLLERLDD